MNVAALRPTRALAAPSRPSQADPTPPTTAIDFSVIDSPQKAALLPVLTASVFELLLNTTSIAGTSGVNSFAAEMHMTAATTPIDLTHSDTAPTTLTLDGSGTAGTAAVTERWHFDDQGLLIQGTVGASTEDLRVTAQDDGLHMDGTIGSVEVHQRITVEGSGVDEKVTWDGTVGDQKLHQERTYVEDTRGLVHDHVVGTLGDAPILYDQHITADDASSISFSREGQIAGVPIRATHDFRFQYLADPPPSPSPEG